MNEIASGRDACASSESPVRGCIDELFVFDGVQRYKIAAGEPIPYDGVLEVRGWATIGDPPHTASTFEVIVAGSLAHDVRHRLPRADVAAHLQSDGASDCGFIFRIDPESLALPDGTSAVRVVLDGSGEVFAFEIRADRSPAQDARTERRFTYAPVESGGDTVDGPGKNRVERGIIAVVRGTLRDRDRAGTPYDLRLAVNRSVSYPVLVDRADDDGTLHVLAFVPTDTLEIGSTTFRFLTRAAPDEAYERSERFALEVTPICLYESLEPYRQTVTLGRAGWSGCASAGTAKHARRGEIVHLDGWIVNNRDVCATGAAYLVFDDGQQFAMDMGAKRPDAVAAAGSSYALFSGFAGSIDTSYFEAGVYEARLYAVSHDAATLFTCDAALTLVVEAVHDLRQ